MNKKEIVRKHLLTLKNGATFTISSIAKSCKVSTKDVSNVTGPMFNSGVFDRIVDNNIHIYTVDSNAIALYSAKYPQGMPHENEKKSVTSAKPKAVASKANGSDRKKRRSPVLVEIDRKIVMYNTKISDLKIMRKEFT